VSLAQASTVHASVRTEIRNRATPILSGVNEEIAVTTSPFGFAQKLNSTGLYGAKFIACLLLLLTGRG
jgi:hypothetical protein